jgi:hypothetical protein
MRPDEAYRDGRRKQDEIIASNPDVSVNQWMAKAGALRTSFAALDAERERIRGRLDAIGRHIGRMRAPNVTSSASGEDPPER